MHFIWCCLISLLLRNDTNTLVLPDLGKLRQVRILHDNSGSTPSWFLEKVRDYTCVEFIIYSRGHFSEEAESCAETRNAFCTFNSQFTLWDVPAGNRGSCIHHLRLDICFDEYNYHDSMQGRLIEGMGDCLDSSQATWISLVNQSHGHRYSKMDETWFVQETRIWLKRTRRKIPSSNSVRTFSMDQSVS